MQTPSATRAAPPAPRTRHRWLLLVPFLWQVALVPAVNGVSWSPGHIPFPMFWQMLGVVLASVVIGVVFLADRRAGVDEEEAAFLRATDATIAREQAP